MSVLDNLAPGENNPAARIANNLKQQTRMTYNQLVQTFNASAQSFWANPRAKPSEIAAALGADAREVFELHAKLGALLGAVKPEAIAPGLAVVGQFTVNDDGTIAAVDPTPTNG